MTTYVDYHHSPLHQGSRSRTGDQVDRQLVTDLLRVLGDCRLLWLPNLTDTTTSTERSRHAGTVTWSESLASFDLRPARLGSGVAVAFNGTDEEGDVPDADRCSFGDGAADQGFSVGALIKPDVTNATMVVMGKQESSAAEEWLLQINPSGYVALFCRDESAGGQISQRDETSPIGTDWVLVVATYDGSRTRAGISIYRDGVETATYTNGDTGTYEAMENTAARVHIGARYATKERFFDGSMAFAFVTAKVLGADDLWTMKELANSYFGLSL